MQKKNHVLGQLWIPWVCILTFGFSAFAIFAQGNPRVSAVLRLKIWTEDRKHAYAERYKIPIHIELTNVTSRDVFIGRDVWSNIYPSHVTLIVMPTDGHAMTGEAGNVDGLGLSDDLARQCSIAVSCSRPVTRMAQLARCVKTWPPGLIRSAQCSRVRA